MIIIKIKIEYDKYICTRVINELVHRQVRYDSKKM